MKKINLIILILSSLTLVSPVFAQTKYAFETTSSSSTCQNVEPRSVPVANDPDVNLRVRGWSNSTNITNPTTGSPNVLIDVGGPTDTNAPQLSTLVNGSVNTDPKITGLFQVNNVGSGTPVDVDGSSNWGATLMELAVSPTDVITVPHSGYEVHTGYQVTVLYATATDLTLKYTLEDDVIKGYTIHLVDMQVSPDLLSLYQKNETLGRTTLLALPCGYVLGLPGSGGKFKVAIRDTGTFIDPRVRKDWWHQPASLACTNAQPSYFAPLASTICQNSQGNTPLQAGFVPLTHGCDAKLDPEYHPLRPYPGSPCDPLIPRSIPEAPEAPYKKYNTFACGTALTPEVKQVFDPYGDNSYYEGLPPIKTPDGGTYAHTICNRVPADLSQPGTVTCYRTSSFLVTVDLAHANLGILGNTQDPNLTDAQKVNEYLSWYLTGTPQIGGLEPIDSNSPKSLDTLVNFSGPLRKLLPEQMLNTIRTTVADSNTKEVHDSIVADGLLSITGGRLDRVSSSVNGFIDGATGIVGTIVNDEILQRLMQNVPFSSMEDTAGEVVLSVFKDSSNGQQQPNLIDGYSQNGRSTAPIKLIIQSASKASK